MESYVYTRQLNGFDDLLTIKNQDDGTFLVFQENFLIGNIYPVRDNYSGQNFWESNDEVLIGCAAQMGEFIETYEG